jgi:H+-transporting ATPase
MLEAAVVLECAMGKFVEAGVIAGLLVFNAVLGLVQESRAQAMLTALKSRLALNASVLRDGKWSTVRAADLVKGDVVKLSLGGVVAADMLSSRATHCSTIPCSLASPCRSKPPLARRHLPVRS